MTDDLPSTTQNEERPLSHSPKRRARKWLKWSATASISLLLVVVGCGYGAYRYATHSVESKIKTVPVLKDYQRPVRSVVAPKAENLLILGSDTRAGANGEGIGGETPGLSDTTVLLHLSADRSFAYGVSIPRDTMVERPACPRKDGTGEAPAALAQWNEAYALGGPACTVKQVETLTGVHVDHFLVVDFSGFKDLIDQVGGVSICVPQEVNDTVGHIHLAKGTYVMDGKTALDYVRVRHGIGVDLGDIGRMKRQQVFMSALADKLMGENLLANPVKTLHLAESMASTLTTDPEFAHAKTMIQLADSLKAIGMDHVQFITTPWEAYPADHNRVQWTRETSNLWRNLIADKPLSRVLASTAVTAGTSTSTPPSKTTRVAPNGAPSANAAVSSTDENTASPTTGLPAEQNSVYGLC